MLTSKNIKILRKSSLKMKFLAMHITNQILSFDIFTVQNIFMEHDLNIIMIFGIIDKCIFLTHTVLLSIAVNIPVLLMTASVLQGHMYDTRLSVLQIPVLVRLEPRRAQDRALRFGRQRQDGAGAGRAGAAQRSDL